MTAGWDPLRVAQLNGSGVQVGSGLPEVAPQEVVVGKFCVISSTTSDRGITLTSRHQKPCTRQNYQQREGACWP